MQDIPNIDIHDLLAERKEIAVIWCIEDVQQVRPDLDEDQCWRVLQTASRKHDANCGINWEMLEITAEVLFGDAPDADEA